MRLNRLFSVAALALAASIVAPAAFASPELGYVPAPAQSGYAVDAVAFSPGQSAPACTACHAADGEGLSALSLSVDGLPLAESDALWTSTKPADVVETPSVPEVTYAELRRGIALLRDVRSQRLVVDIHGADTPMARCSYPVLAAGRTSA